MNEAQEMSEYLRTFQAMNEDQEKIDSLDIPQDAKDFINQRTSRTFQQQYYFYYNISMNHDRAMVRAIEETIQIYGEESHYEALAIKKILYSNESDTDKINQLKTQF